MESDNAQITETARVQQPTSMAMVGTNVKPKFTLPAGVILKSFLVLIVAFGSGLGLWYYLNQNSRQSKASEWIATVSFSNTSIQAKKGDVVKTVVNITTSGTGKISAFDIVFQDEGRGLDFQRELLQNPTGFTDLALTDTQIIGPMTREKYASRPLARLAFVSQKSASQLPSTVSLPISFKVNADIPGETVIFKSIIKEVLVTGPGAPSGTYTIRKPNELEYRVSVSADAPTPTPDPRAAMPTGLTCDSTPGQNIILKWKDSANEDGYRVYRDGGQTPIATLGKNTSTYVYNWCGDFGNHQYRVIAYNAVGSVSTTEPSINCSCKPVPTAPPPTPTPRQVLNSADIIFKLNFPDVAATSTTVSNIKIEVYNGSVLACPSCTQTVTFTRNGKYFESPQLSFPLKQTMPYTFVVKQQKTLRRSYKFVFLQWEKLLNCATGSNSGCGQLLSEIDSRPMLSGDIDGGMDSQNSGFNVINEVDLNKVEASTQSRSDEGDINFDGVTDVKDVGIVGKNFNKKGD